MIEHERSYVFTHDGVREFLKSRNISLSDSTRIVDNYLSREMRVRSESGRNGMLLTRKMGQKSDGYRFEDEQRIGYDAGQMLAMESKLSVVKDRCVVLHGEQGHLSVTVDFVLSPMRIAVLEVEAVSEVRYPLPLDISRRLFGVDLKDCPLSSWELFRRKIGVCGGPSSGKTEMAKGISHLLNTEFQANSFHVAEYATTFIQKYRRPPSFRDQFLVLLSQIQRESDADTANIVVSDCPTFLSYLYALHLLDEPFSPTVSLYLSKVYKRALRNLETYSDLILMRIQNYVENNVRYQTPEEALKIERRIVSFLDDHHIKYSQGSFGGSMKSIHELFYINE